jgi:hypothetical protein
VARWAWRPGSGLSFLFRCFGSQFSQLVCFLLSCARVRWPGNPWGTTSSRPPHGPPQSDGISVQKPGSQSCAKLILLFLPAWSHTESFRSLSAFVGFRCAAFAGRLPASTPYKGKRRERLQRIFWRMEWWSRAMDREVKAAVVPTQAAPEAPPRREWRCVAPQRRKETEKSSLPARTLLPALSAALRSCCCPCPSVSPHQSNKPRPLCRNVARSADPAE